MLWGVLAKSITASLVILKGELYECNQLRRPLVHSIICFRMVCALSRVFAVATKAQSLMKPVDISDLPLAMSIRSAL